MDSHPSPLTSLWGTDVTIHTTTTKDFAMSSHMVVPHMPTERRGPSGGMVNMDFGVYALLL